MAAENENTNIFETMKTEIRIEIPAANLTFLTTAN